MPFFVAFYSFKGGVGRSLALSNVAWSLAARGKRVVLVDMDLEAPGLDRVPEFALKGSGSKKGLVEYADYYRRMGKCPGIRSYVHRCKESPGTGELWLMPAGQFGSEYQRKLGTLAWAKLHPRRGTDPFVEGLKEGLASLKADYVLLDSRTGLADIAGLSTHRMADLIVLAFNLTLPCLEGSIRTYRSFTSDISQARGVVLVASPVPPSIPGSASLAETRLRQAAEHMPLGVAYGRKMIQIAYDPAMVLAEALAVRHPDRFPAAERYEALRDSIQRANPEEVFPIVEQAHVLRGEGRLEEGLNLVREFTREHPDNVEGFLALGDMLLEADRSADAVQAFRSAQAIEPEFSITYRRLGEALVRQKDGVEAVEALKRAEELGDNSSELYRALTRAYGQLNNPTKELDARREALKALLGAPDRLETSLPDVQALRQEFVQVLSRRPPYPGFEVELFWDEVMGSLSFSLKEKAFLLRDILEGSLDTKALWALRQDLQEEDQRWLEILGASAPELQKRVALSFVDINHEETARTLLRGDVVDAALLGLLSYQITDPKRCSELLEEATRIDPYNPELLCGLGTVLAAELAPTADEQERKHLYRQASSRFQVALEIKPDLHEALNNWGSALTHLARVSCTDERKNLLLQAADKYKQAILLKPDQHVVLYNWGLTLAELARLTTSDERKELLLQALDKYNQALEIKPGTYTALYNSGNVLAHLAEISDNNQRRELLLQAVAKYKQALEIKSDQYSILYNLACALSHLGEISEATDFIQTALERNPAGKSQALQDTDLQTLWAARPDLKEALEKELVGVEP